MELRLEELLAKITEFIKAEARTESIIGEPVQLGEFTCVPVIKVSVGFGSGGGERGGDSKNGKAMGAGAAAGVTINPIGFLVSRGKEISFLSTDKATGFAAIFDKVPDLIGKIAEIKNAEDKKKEK